PLLCASHYAIDDFSDRSLPISWNNPEFAGDLARVQSRIGGSRGTSRIVGGPNCNDFGSWSAGANCNVEDRVGEFMPARGPRVDEMEDASWCSRIRQKAQNDGLQCCGNIACAGRTAPLIV